MVKRIIFSFSLLILIFSCTADAKVKLNLPVDAFEKKMSLTNVVLLDVRTPDEYTKGRLKGSININIYERDFPTKIAKLDKSKIYLIYCWSGARSSRALNIFKARSPSSNLR